jgi:cysteine desulfurase
VAGARDPVKKSNTLTQRRQEAEKALLILLDKEGICASSGSACLADSDEQSHVIKAMKPDAAASRQRIRFSMDAASAQEQIALAVTAVRRSAEVLTQVGSRT